MSVELEFYGGRQPKYVIGIYTSIYLLLCRKAPPVMDTEMLLESFHNTFAIGSTTNVFSVGQLVGVVYDFYDVICLHFS